MNNFKRPKKFRKKKKLGSYPYVSVVFSITLALFVIGLFGLLLLHAQKLTQIIKENVEVQIYLNKYITDNDRIKINQTLASKEFIFVKDGEAQIEFLSKEEAAQQFIEDTGEDFVEFLGDNPLHDAYTIKLKPEFQNSEQLKIIKSEIESMPGIHEVTYVESLINSINKNVRQVSFILACFAAILLITVVILINNTIKLALFSQRFLIRSMQLVGATSSFIQRPFLVRATVHGTLAGIAASIMLAGLLTYTNRQVQDLSALQERDQILILFVFIVLTGTFIGFISTYYSVKKYLQMSLDDLY
ncbi:MAG: ABC transporter permease [Bacteroidota bacterium]|nr:ABC transporter permease [Bacteroidota bacterium]